MKTRSNAASEKGRGGTSAHELGGSQPSSGDVQHRLALIDPDDRALQVLRQRPRAGYRNRNRVEVRSALVFPAKQYLDLAQEAERMGAPRALPSRAQHPSGEMPGEAAHTAGMSHESYLLADQPSELERLQLQSRVWEPAGRQLLSMVGEARADTPSTSAAEPWAGFGSKRVGRTLRQHRRHRRRREPARCRSLISEGRGNLER